MGGGIGIGIFIMIILLWNIMKYLQLIEKGTKEQVELSKKIIEL